MIIDCLHFQCIKMWLRLVLIGTLFYLGTVSGIMKVYGKMEERLELHVATI